MPFAELKVVQGILVLQDPNTRKDYHNAQVTLVHIGKEFAKNNLTEGIYAVTVAHTVIRHFFVKDKVIFNKEQLKSIRFQDPKFNINLTAKNVEVFVIKDYEEKVKKEKFQKNFDLAFIKINENLINEEQKKIIKQFKIAQKKSCIGEYLGGLSFDTNETIEHINFALSPTLKAGKVVTEGFTYSNTVKIDVPSHPGDSGTGMVNGNHELCACLFGESQKSNEPSEYHLSNSLRNVQDTAFQFVNSLTKLVEYSSEYGKSVFVDIGLFLSQKETIFETI